MKGSVTQKWGIAAAEQRGGGGRAVPGEPTKGLTQHSGTLPGPISARFSLPVPSEGGFVIGAQWPTTGSEYPLARGSYRPEADFRASNMHSIRDLAEKYPELLRGERKESEDGLNFVERALDVRLPTDVRWLLLECGYGGVGAVANIQESIADTLRFRAAVDLNSKYVVLEDKGDAGVILLDTSTDSGSVVWTDSHSVGLLHAGTGDWERFDSFSAWVEDRVIELGDE